MSKKSEATKEMILDAAKESINELGVEAAGLREIARRSGKFVGNLGYYFEGKSGIVRDLLRKELQLNYHEVNGYSPEDFSFGHFIHGLRDALDFEKELPGIFKEIPYLEREGIRSDEFLYPILESEKIRQSLKQLSSNGRLQSGFEDRELDNLAELIQSRILCALMSVGFSTSNLDNDQKCQNALNSVILLLNQYATLKGENELNSLLKDESLENED